MTLKPTILIRQNYDTLSGQQKKIADYLLSNLAQAQEITISRLAEDCELTAPTVIRFVNKLGYASYRKFRTDLIKEMTGVAEPVGRDGYQDIGPEDDVVQIKQKVAYAASAALQELPRMLDTGSLQESVELLHSARDIVFFGVGGSGIVAEDAYQRFLRLGFRVSCDANAHFSVIRAIRMEEQDVLVLVSHKGESREVLECAANAKRNGGRVIAITSYRQSALAALADVSLFSSTHDAPFYTDAMVSRLIQLAILDMLFIGVSLRMGAESAKEIALSREALRASKKKSES